MIWKWTERQVVISEQLELQLNFQRFIGISTLYGVFTMRSPLKTSPGMKYKWHNVIIKSLCWSVRKCKMHWRALLHLQNQKRILHEWTYTQKNYYPKNVSLKTRTFTPTYLNFLECIVFCLVHRMATNNNRKVTVFWCWSFLQPN